MSDQMFKIPLDEMKGLIRQRLIEGGHIDPNSAADVVTVHNDYDGPHNIVGWIVRVGVRPKPGT